MSFGIRFFTGMSIPHSRNETLDTLVIFIGLPHSSFNHSIKIYLRNIIYGLFEHVLYNPMQDASIIIIQPHRFIHDLLIHLTKVFRLSPLYNLNPSNEKLIIKIGLTCMWDAVVFFLSSKYYRK